MSGEPLTIEAFWQEVLARVDTLNTRLTELNQRDDLHGFVLQSQAMYFTEWVSFLPTRGGFPFCTAMYLLSILSVLLCIYLTVHTLSPFCEVRLG